MIGTTVSHYRILEHIGSGGMGVVYLAEDIHLHRKVALKFLNEIAAEGSEAHERLVREAQAEGRSIIRTSLPSTKSARARGRCSSSWPITPGRR